jgi:hypothetical protein
LDTSPQPVFDNAIAKRTGKRQPERPEIMIGRECASLEEPRGRRSEPVPVPASAAATSSEVTLIAE